MLASREPPYLLQHFVVRVVGLDELVLTDPSAEADDVRHLVLLLLQKLGDHFVRLLPVALTVTSEEQKYILYFGRCTPTFTDSANSRPFYASFNDNFILLIYYKTILT